jgi:hypothetical protein
MVPNIESLNVRSSLLQDTHADLLRKMDELARLRRQVQLREAALHAKATSQNRLRKMLPTTARAPSYRHYRSAG